jgi:flagellin-like hook-associated protein FlgL
MSVSSVSSQTSLIVQSLVDMRKQLDSLQQQIGTGKKSDTYAGMGLDRGLAVGLRTQLAAIGGFDDTITNVGVRINLAQTSLGRIADIAHTVKAAAIAAPAIDASGSTTAQQTASMELREVLGLLNTQAGDRYIFSGRAGDTPSVETFDHIMNGDATRAGLLQVTNERKQADLGTGSGRLLITQPTGTSVKVAEDAVSPFGFKIAGVTSNLTGSTVTPSGPPTASTVDLGGTNPNNGETVRYDLTLPDGSSESLTLTATTSATPGPNEFTIGANSTITAGNMLTTLNASVAKLADTSLTAASAMAAANDFFNIDAANPPLRVQPSPTFATATTLVPGTAANTVSWYTGEAGSDPARGTATARVDPTISVSYGLRANEQGIRWVVQNVAALAAMTFSQSDPNAAARNAALQQRVAPALDVPAGTQKVEDIETELAGAQTTMASATDRHNQTKTTLANMVDHIEGVSNEEVASKILALQTSLQASMQTTALLLKTNLTNYI